MDKLNVLVGKTFSSVQNLDNQQLVFTETNGQRYQLFHQQQCCEDVYIESVVGDLADLVGSPLLLAEESSSHHEDDQKSVTWTFYKFATIRGYVDVRWYGTSNGLYSERVSFSKM